MANKDFQIRMQGMVYACRIAQEQGVDALVAEVKKRGVTKVDITATQSSMNEMWGTLTDCIFQNIMTTAAWVLSEQFGFGKKRLQKFIQEFTQATEDVKSLDYMGEHYVTLEDYAVELNSKYKLGLDTIKAALETEMHDKQNPRYQNTETVDGIINALRLAGYKDAAEFLKRKERRK